MSQVEPRAPYTVLYDSAIRGLKSLRNGYVLCLVYRHCQMRNHVFSAGIQNKAADLGINHKQLRAALHSLKEQGYIQDLTPDAKNRPHNYIVTPKGINLLSDNGQYSLMQNSKSTLPNGEGEGLPNGEGEGLPNGESRSTQRGDEEYHLGIQNKEYEREGAPAPDGVFNDVSDDEYYKMKRYLLKTGVLKSVADEKGSMELVYWTNNNQRAVRQEIIAAALKAKAEVLNSTTRADTTNWQQIYHEITSVSYSKIKKLPLALKEFLDKAAKTDAVSLKKALLKAEREEKGIFRVDVLEEFFDNEKRKAWANNYR